MTPPLPPICDVVVDAATLAQLFFDVSVSAELVGVTVKARGARRAAEAPAELAAVHDALRDGTIAGAQLRYRLGDEEWWDTVLQVEGGFRLVRINHTRAVAAASSSGDP